MNKIFIQLMKQRGITDEFLHPVYENLADPFLLPDMEKAIDRIVQAIENGDHILIYGDYDVDGVTASTVMEEALRLAGAQEIDIMLPDRFADGYGMSPKIIQRAKDLGVKLVVTVDCGSSNQAIIDELKTLGIDTVVTDHHEITNELPDAVAVVNPKRQDYQGFRDLAGVGVAFKVAQGLVSRGLIPSGQEKWLLDLVLIGTICDNMPLLNENRILSFYGMKVLAKTRRLGLKELMLRAGVKTLNSDAIGFQIGPRLNAAGRLESAELSLNLLMAKKKSEAAAIAEKLETLNKKRKTEQQLALDEIRARGVSEGPIIIEVGKWNEGILGIVAGKLTEEYHKPSFVLSEVGEGIYKGSGRSFGEFNLALALAACRDYIINGGGHALAAGVKVAGDKLYEFREKMAGYYESLGLKDQERFLTLREDLSIDALDDINLELADDLALLEPFGGDNEEPVFQLHDFSVVEARLMGAEKQHLSLIVEDGKGQRIKLLSFFAPEEWCKVSVGARLNVWVKLAKNEWNGIESVEGKIIGLNYI